MKISLAQINAKVGDLSGNARKIAAFARKAHNLKAELVVFPEAALTGYPAWDLWEDKSFIEANVKALQNLADKVRQVPCVVGYIDYNRSGSGKNLLNSAALLQNGKITAVRAKTLLPTYDVFDEARYFESAKTNLPVKIGRLTAGVTICEDVWNAAGLNPRRLYRSDPVEKLAVSSLDLLINLSASPYHRGKVPLRYELLKNHARKTKTPFIYCNLVGGNDELVFDGNSLVIDEQGGLIARGKAFEEDLVTFDFPFRSAPLEWQSADEAPEIYSALVLGVRDYAAKTGFKKAVLGLSGGIDSAVVCAIAAKALGPGNVTGVSLPSPYTSPASREDAKKLAKNLGVNFLEIPITPVFNAYLKSLKKPFAGLRPDTAEENIQSRVRGATLMALSNKFGGLLLATGNKSELATGYCTLYGDMCGALAPLADIVKTTVYALARHANSISGAVPERSISRAPTAELRHNQKDQDELPPYEMLDKIVKAYIEEGKNADEIAALGVPKDITVSVLDRIDRNEFKRRQAPPGIKITPKAFGFGRRMPIARGCHRLP